MKYSALFSLIIITLFSCTKDDKFDPDKFPQTWQLIKMTGQIAHSETTGSDMQWQEFYLLRSDGTFIKSRDWNGIHTEASGTFLFNNSADGKFLELTYYSDNEIIGSCYSVPRESLWLKSDNKLLGTWSYCDGPGLEYERR